MSDIKHALFMISVARRDLLALAHMLDPEIFHDEAFGFHAQQAVEKAIKAWLSLRGVVYPHKHDLALLFDLLAQTGESGAEPFRGLTELRDYATWIRYGYASREPLDRPATVESVTRLVETAGRAIADVAGERPASGQ